MIASVKYFIPAAPLPTRPRCCSHTQGAPAPLYPIRREGLGIASACVVCSVQRGVEEGGEVVVLSDSPRPPRRQQRGGMPNLVPSETSGRLQQRYIGLIPWVTCNLTEYGNSFLWGFEDVPKD